MQVWNVLHAASWKYRTQKLRRKSPSAHHHTTLSGYIFATKTCIDNRKKSLNGNTSTSICMYNIVNFGPLTAEIRRRVWETPANINGFRVLASLLQRRRTTEVNQSLHDVDRLLHWYTIYAFWGLLPPNGILPAAKVTLRPSLAFSYIGSVTARHSSSGRQPHFVAWY